MGALIRAHDWSGSSLGPPDSWPQSLKTALSICLGSKFPMVIWWGAELSVFYNDAYIPILGPQKHPMYLGRPAKEQWPEIWDVVGTLAHHVIATGEATWSEDQPLFMVRKGFVEEAYFTFSFSPAREESGAVGGMFCAVQEMTARVQGERRLKLLRELSAQEVKSLDEVGESVVKALSTNPHDVPFALVYLTSGEGQSAALVGAVGIRAGSPAAPLRLELGRTEGEVWPLGRINQSRQAERVVGLRSRFPGDLPKIPYEERPDSAYLLPIQPAGQGSPAGFLILGVNPRLEFNDGYEGFFGLVCKHLTSQISNIRALEEEKKRSEALAEIDRTKTKFFSNVSHEFRTPLTLMLGPVEDLLAGNQGELPPAVRAQAEVVHRNALRLLKLVNALLDFSRVESGRAQVQFGPVDLAALTADIASSFRSAMERAGLKFTVKLTPLPEPVFVDSDMWEKIVLNLLSNAFKFTLQGEVQVELVPLDGAVQLSVTDSGAGIPEEELPKVFQRFHRVQGAKGRTHEGTGIGLALVQEFAKLHGGAVMVRSTLGQGSAFTVTLPMGNLHLPQDRLLVGPQVGSAANRADVFVEEATLWGSPADPEKAATGVLSPQEQGSPRSVVLLADDNADMREYVRKLLVPRYEVVTAANGRLALESARERRPDLLLSDIMMPELDGIELLRAVRADESLRTLPVILLSARAGEEEKSSGIELGADDYLTKPFSAKELLARVQTQLHMAGIRQRATAQESILVHLKAQQQWLESVLDLVPTPLLMIEPETGRIKFANQAANVMSGGQLAMDIPVEDYASVYRLTDEAGQLLPTREFPTARAARGEKVTDAEVVWHTAAGQFSLLIDSEAVAASAGHPSRIILTLRDVTRMKQVQAELKRLISARDEFLSIASHELKTPLTSIQLQTQMIQRNLERGDPSALAPARMARMVEQTDRMTKRLTHLVNSMLDISQIDRGKLSLQTEPCDLAELVFDVVDRLSLQLIQAATRVEIIAPEPVVGQWDRFKLEQVLINLLTNAARYGERKPIEVSVLRVGSTAELKIRDHGRGIAEEDQQRIFQRFERAIKASEVSGLGLGLYIARQITEMHQGTIEVASQPGEGAAFTVKLPVGEAAQT